MIGVREFLKIKKTMEIKANSSRRLLKVKGRMCAVPVTKVRYESIRIPITLLEI